MVVEQARHSCCIEVHCQQVQAALLMGTDLCGTSGVSWQSLDKSDKVFGTAVILISRSSALRCHLHSVHTHCLRVCFQSTLVGRVNISVRTLVRTVIACSDACGSARGRQIDSPQRVRQQRLRDGGVLDWRVPPQVCRDS